MAPEGVDLRNWRLDELDAGSPAWSDLLRRHDHLPFHQPEWNRIVLQGLSDRPICLGFIHQGEPVAGMMGFRYGSLGLRIGHFSFPYGGVFGNPPPGPIMADLLHDFGRREGLAEIRLIDYPNSPPIDGAGFELQPDQTQVIDLRGHDAESLRKAYSSNIRRDLKVAEKKGVTVTTVGDESVDTFYDLYLSTMNRKGALAKYKRPMFQAIADHLIPEDRACLMLAYRGGEAIAGLVAVDSEHTSFYLMSGSVAESRSYRPNQLLWHSAVVRALKLGKQWFDLLPSGSENPSLVEFKRKWGSTSVPLTNRILTVRPSRMWLWRMAYRCAQWGPVQAMFNRIRSRR